MEGIHGMLREGDKISLARLEKKEQYLIAWVGGKDKPAGQIGVAAVDPKSALWDDVLEAVRQSALGTGRAPGAYSQQVTSKTNAAGAGR